MADPGSLIALAHASGVLTLDGFARLSALGQRREFGEGAVLMRQDTEADTMYVILSGRVNVVREHRDLANPVILATLGPGEIVGEMGLLDGDPRSATVTALEPTVTMEVPASALAEAVRRYPDIYASLIKVLSRRLRATNELVAEATGGGPAPDAARGTT